VTPDTYNCFSVDRQSSVLQIVDGFRAQFLTAHDPAATIAAQLIQKLHKRPGGGRTEKSK